MTKSALQNQWAAKVREHLVGRTITDVQYLPAREQNEMMWDRSGIVLILDDGNSVYPSQDDEGNGPGALFTSFEDLPIVPVI